MTSIPLERPDLHVCIATGQNLANLIPAVQCRAREVWILQTPAMRASAAHLQDALRARGAATKRIDFADDEVAGLHVECARLAEALDGRPVVINITGGTKQMTLALTDTLAGHLGTGAPGSAPHLVYTDTVRQRLDWLRPSPVSEPMQDVLTLNDILLVQGYRQQEGSAGARSAEWQRASSERAPLTRYLGEHAEALASFFGKLNWAAHSALNEPDGPWEPRQPVAIPSRNAAAAKAIELAQSHSLLHREGERHVVFHDQEAARYLGGGWVEELAGLKLEGAPRARWAPNLRVRHVDTGSENEIDLAVVNRNRLLVVECKAQSPDDRKVSDWIYKLSQLARAVGGHLAQPLLLSARPLPEMYRQRASEYGVDVLDGEGIDSLGAYLRRWAR
jgi:hypothetical protein